MHSKLCFLLDAPYRMIRSGDVAIPPLRSMASNISHLVRKLAQLYAVETAQRMHHSTAAIAAL
eukprot:4844955-Prymnesium_polylepis.1